MTESKGPDDRRSAVMTSALTAFTRFGYRKTSMEEIARAARISRPGLYFLFASKEDLFRAAVAHALDADLATIENTLGDYTRPIEDRMLEAFDHWAGQYVGPLARDLTAVMDDNPNLLGEIILDKPGHFSDLVVSALQASGRSAANSTALAQTLISTSIGVKHQSVDREEYRGRLATAIELLALHSVT